MAGRKSGESEHEVGEEEGVKVEQAQRGSQICKIIVTSSHFWRNLMAEGQIRCDGSVTMCDDVTIHRRTGLRTRPDVAGRERFNFTGRTGVSPVYEVGQAVPACL